MSEKALVYNGIPRWQMEKYRGSRNHYRTCLLVLPTSKETEFAIQNSG